MSHMVSEWQLNIPFSILLLRFHSLLSSFLLFFSVSVSLGVPLFGDQSLGGLRSNRLSDRPHCLHDRHRGGAASWDQIPSGQREYPDSLYTVQTCAAQ